MGAFHSRDMEEEHTEQKEESSLAFDVRAMPYGGIDQQLSLGLRYQILREPLGLEFDAEQLAEEATSIHLGAFVEFELIGCLVLDMQEETQQMKLRQLAVDSVWQGHGVGCALVERAQQLAISTDCALYCHARATAVPFYTRLGWVQEGESFEEIGLPHYRMNAPPSSP